MKNKIKYQLIILAASRSLTKYFTVATMLQMIMRARKDLGIVI
jgi:hypothetical protein